MIGFSQYLKEEKAGDITARQGHANEFFTDMHSNKYAQAVQEALNKGASEEEAHKLGIAAIHATEYNHQQHMNHPKAKDFVETLGPDASKIVHENSKQTAAAASDYIFHKYGGRILKSIWVGAGQAKAAEQETGMKTNADLVFKTAHNGEVKDTEAHLEHEPFQGLGGSLKYSSSEKDSDTKIHSPGISTLAKFIDDHHQQMFGKTSTVQKDIEAARQEGQENQRRVVAKLNSKGVPHHEVVSDFLEKLRTNPEKYRPTNVKQKAWEALINKAQYNPVSHKNSNSIEKADFDENLLSLVRKATRSKPEGIDHEGLSEFYKDVSAANSGMRNRIAEHVHNHLSRILDHQSNDPQEQTRIDQIKKSLHRHIANVHEPSSGKKQLPTILLKTAGDGTVSISDTNEAFRSHLGDRSTLSRHNKNENTGSFRVGPGTLTIDNRPGTMHNPLKNPANYTIPSSFLKKTTVKYKNGKFDQGIEKEEGSQEQPVQVVDKPKKTRAKIKAAPSVVPEPAVAAAPPEKPKANPTIVGLSNAEKYRRVVKPAAVSNPITSKPRPGIGGRPKPAKEPSWNDFHPND